MSDILFLKSRFELFNNLVYLERNGNDEKKTDQ